MKILIVSSFFPPQHSTESLRPYLWAKYWTIAGHDVTVLTTQKQQDPNAMLYLPNPGFKVVEVPLSNFIQSLRSKDRMNSTLPFYKKILRKIRRKKGILNNCRMPDLTDLWIRPALKTIETMGPWDIVFSTSNPYSTHLIAHQLKKKNLAKQWVADYRNPWSTHHIFPGIFPFNIIERKIENRILKRANQISTTSQSTANELKKAFNLDRITVIENGLDPDELKEIPQNSIFIKDGKFRIVHTGSVDLEKQNPIPLFQAIKYLKNDPEKYHLLDKLEVIFTGTNQNVISEMAEKMEISTWVKSLGFISREDSLRMQRDAHALLFLPWNDSNDSGALSGKIFEYLFSKTPLVCIGGKNLEASQLLVLEAEAGNSLQDENEIKHFLINNLKSAKKNESSPNLNYLNRYTSESLAHKLLDQVKNHV